MTETLVNRLANIVRKYEPNASVLQEVACHQCTGVGSAFIAASCCGSGFHLHTCYYCGGKGSGFSDAYQSSLSRE